MTTNKGTLYKVPRNMQVSYGKYDTRHGLTLREIKELKGYCWMILAGSAVTIGSAAVIAVKAFEGALMGDPIILGVTAAVALLGLVLAIAGIIALYPGVNPNQSQFIWKVLAYTPPKRGSDHSASGRSRNSTHI